MAKTKYKSESSCDLYTKCDPYVEIFVNDTRVFRAPPVAGYIHAEDAYVFDTYRSDRMNKTLEIDFKVWDYDAFFLLITKKDLIIQWNTQIDQIPYNVERVSGKNSLSLISYWQDEYDEKL